MPTVFGFALLLLGLMAAPASAQSNFWRITQLPMANAMEPTINNSGEIVWAESPSGGILSSVRGRLSESGFLPHLANSGEVVFADWFGGPYWDLVSTTRGRLTYGGIVDINAATFDVNAEGEVVYGSRDTNGYLQIFSTMRNQITSGNSTHQGPCINDLGEIIWTEYLDDVGAAIVSTTRGVMPGHFGWLLDLNNLGEFCSSGALEGPPGFYTSPHIFSSAHGFIINDPQLLQWNGAINDAGTVVWEAPSKPGAGTWYLYKAEWITGDHTPPEMGRITATPDVLWPPNHRMIPVSLSVEATDDLDPSPVARIIQVTSNGAEDASDWEITGPLTVNLRATRPGQAKERVYTIVVECVDASGNASSKSVTVRVSPDNKKAH